jgi:Leucine-rich repeat (LRR) protein
MNRTIFILLTTLIPVVSAQAVSLEESARQCPLVVRTIPDARDVDLGEGNQTNNLKPGDKVLLLSSRNLTSLDGISRLTVVDEGRPTPIARVPRLQVFLNDNEISAVPAEIAALQNVTFLYLNQNRIAEIPPAIAEMKGLLGMYFTGNAITEIPAWIFTMRQLKKLQVSKNRLTEVPSGIGKLTNLIHLNLSNNAITALPDSIAALTKLRVCDFSGNQLTRLPEAFGDVRILYQLRVRGNPLTALPAGFARMPGTIDITGTKIRLEDLSPALRARIDTEKPAIKPHRDRGGADADDGA